MTEYRIATDGNRVAILDEQNRVVAEPPRTYGPGMAREWCLDRLRQLAKRPGPEWPAESGR
jgi:hypothetical protein